MTGLAGIRMVEIREPPPVLLDFFFKASINDFHYDPPWLSRS
jgi:hypothetical protein